MGTRTQQQQQGSRAAAAAADDDGDDVPGLGNTTTTTTVSGQSVSMSGSVGSPSSRSEQTMVTPASGDNNVLRLNHLDIHADDAGSQGALGSLSLSLSTMLALDNGLGLRAHQKFFNLLIIDLYFN